LTRSMDPVFQVDGNPLLAPDADVRINENDLDAESSGRDESGFLHRRILRESVRTWSFSYAHLSAEDYAYIISLFKGKPTFAFAFAEPDGTVATTTAYCAKRSIILRDHVSGGYKNLKFNIIEC